MGVVSFHVRFTRRYTFLFKLSCFSFWSAGACCQCSPCRKKDEDTLAVSASRRPLWRFAVLLNVGVLVYDVASFALLDLDRTSLAMLLCGGLVCWLFVVT